MSVERKAGKAGLIIPFAVVGVLLALWTVWWFVVAHKLERGIDAEVASLQRGGYDVRWSERDVSGWPFRTFVRMKDVRIAAPSGHAVAMSRLHAEANTYELRKWVLAAPEGLTLTRAAKGDVRISGQALRASLSLSRKASTPRLAVELLQPVFTPAAGAERFPLAGAGKVAFELRPRAGSPTDAEARFEIADGRASVGGVLGDILSEQPFSTVWETRITDAERFQGDNWSQAVRGWSAVGGGLADLKGELTAGTSKAVASSSRLTVDQNGRLQGPLVVELHNGAAAVAAFGRAPQVDSRAAAAASAAASGMAALRGERGGEMRLQLEFSGGDTFAGPFRLAPAPKVF